MRVREALGRSSRFPSASVLKNLWSGLTLDDSIAFARADKSRDRVASRFGGIYESAPMIVQPMLLPQGFC